MRRLRGCAPTNQRKRWVETREAPLFWQFAAIARAGSYCSVQEYSTDGVSFPASDTGK